MSSVNSMYGLNPYINTGLNADFMSTATANPYTNPYADPYSQLAALQQPTTDTFQKSEGGSGLNSGLKLAAVGGVGAGAGAYFFGDKLGAALTKDGKTFSDDILKAYQTDPAEIAKTNAVNEFAAQKNAIIQRHGFTPENYEAVKKYVATPAAERANLPKEITDLVPDGVKSNPDNFKAKLFNANAAIEAIDDEAILKQSIEKARTGNLACQQEKLANLVKRKSLVEGLAKNATPAQIEELITKNPATFGIEKTAEAEIQAEAKTIAERLGKDKTTAVNTITNDIKTVETNVGNLRKTLNGQVAAHWDDTAKAFRESAPSQLKNATKSFKWAKAGKFAAIAAGAGLVLGWMFGGNKS